MNIDYEICIHHEKSKLKKGEISDVFFPKRNIFTGTYTRCRCCVVVNRTNNTVIFYPNLDLAIVRIKVSLGLIKDPNKAKEYEWKFGLDNPTTTYSYTCIYTEEEAFYLAEEMKKRGWNLKYTGVDGDKITPDNCPDFYKDVQDILDIRNMVSQ